MKLIKCPECGEKKAEKMKLEDKYYCYGCCHQWKINDLSNLVEKDD